MEQKYGGDVEWTENQWNTVQRTVAEEAQKARIGRRFLPQVGPLTSDVVAVPPLSLTTPQDLNRPLMNPGPGFVPNQRLQTNSEPALGLATISVLVELPRNQLLEPDLGGALTMFRRAANYVARIEDALIFHGQPGPNAAPLIGIAGVPPVFRVTGGGFRNGPVQGLMPVAPAGGNPGGRQSVPIVAPINGANLINAVIQAKIDLEAAGQYGPFHCLFSPSLQRVATNPTAALIMPLDRMLPHLDGGSVFTSSIVPDAPALPPAQFPLGAVVASNGQPLEIVAACDVSVCFLQVTLEPRWVFRVSERIAFRIKEMPSIAVLYQP